MKTARTSRIAFLNSRLLIGFALYGVGLVLAFGSISRAVAGDHALGELSSSIPAQALGGTWTATGDLGTPRDRQTATLLPNDQVLVAGGERLHVKRPGVTTLRFVLVARSAPDWDQCC